MSSKLNLLRMEMIWFFEGELIPNYELTLNPIKPCSYAYCADSKSDDRIIPSIKDSTAMYFETTYLHELKAQAEERGHSTSVQAAEMAKKAQVKVLVTGHYSSRYKNVDNILTEAKEVFENTVLGYDGVMLNIQNLNE